MTAISQPLDLGSLSGAPLSVSALGRVIAGVLADPRLREVWVVGELSDLRTNNGHCYAELCEKDPFTSRTVAKVKFVSWANVWSRLVVGFQAATGSLPVSGMKVMVRGSVSYHPAYGMSFVVSAINPAYTMGEAERNRREILERLAKEGIVDNNRQLEWNIPPMRVAVISAKGAAGYGDFVNQLYNNQALLKFHVKLFPAVLQGERTVASVMSALETIASEQEQWDCVVIIRGGGATTDLLWFDDYNLAANVACFPLPVIVGIGHERDVTVLDYVANMRVKTPTAAAEWLVSQACGVLDRFNALGSDILLCVRERLAQAHSRLAYCEGAIPSLAGAVILKAKARIDAYPVALARIVGKSLTPAMSRLDSRRESLRTLSANVIARAQARIQSLSELLSALSPQSVLARGYSITRVNGVAVTDVASLKPGDVITTTFEKGMATSTINKINQ
ncbi:MAG: exodeoxyribonuclease VII large subunit [Paramuribaculum sp.]|nr:exodeoxyribonuclease VII large subunit [Paramuribaculum sp.]